MITSWKQHGLKEKKQNPLKSERLEFKYTSGPLLAEFGYLSLNFFFLYNTVKTLYFTEDLGLSNTCKKHPEC